MGIFGSTSDNYRVVAFVFTAILYLVLAKGKASLSRGICPAGWQRWEMSCYKSLYPLKINWQDALERCQDLGAHLVTPNSLKEYDFAWRFFSAPFSSTPIIGIWIGCTDEDGDKVWQCDGDTQEVQYRAEWFKAIEDDETCAIIGSRYPHWYAVSCNDQKYVMCERPAPMTKSMTCSIVANDRCLLGHTFRTLTVRGRSQCCLTCHNDQRCRSFNLRGNQCELISTDAEDPLSTALSCNHYNMN